MSIFNAITTVIFVIGSLIVFLSLAYLALTAPDFASTMTFVALAWIPAIALNLEARDARERNERLGV